MNTIFETEEIMKASQLPISLQLYINVLLQERRNSSANALELRLFCTNPST